jgi:hypothetical protein
VQRPPGTVAGLPPQPAMVVSWGAEGGRMKVEG